MSENLLEYSPVGVTELDGQNRTRVRTAVCIPLRTENTRWIRFRRRRRSVTLFVLNLL
jgi:hypothetical protein